MKTWKRLAGVLMTGVMAVGMLAGCGSNTASNGSAPSNGGDGQYKIGYVNLADTDVFCSSRKEAVQAALEADGNYSISFTDGNNDVQKQIDQVNTFIAQGVDAVVIVPCDADGIVPAVKACNSADVPCILIGNACDPSECDYLFIGSPHYNSGYLQGEYVGQLLDESVGIDKAKILYLEGTNGLDHAALRKQGTMEALEKMGFNWDSQCLDSQDADYVKTDAMEKTDAWIQKYVKNGTPEFQAIIAANDQMALGAMESLKGAGILKGNTEVFVSGIDGTADALQAIVDGNMVQTVLQDAPGQGAACLDALNEFLADGKGYDEVGTASESYEGINEIMVDYQSVIADNVADYM
ncbi:MAG: sugar ABC transporter substrate-binding protein [Eubacteriales bacterium]|nr:sugar ABC transporter substrate-binding protein [Eubacteriales bacterium]